MKEESVLSQYFRSLYQDTMHRAYDTAYRHLAGAAGSDATILECGANNGRAFDLITKRLKVAPGQYHGIEWNARCVEEGRKRGFNIVHGDLNRGLPHASETFSCAYALSVLEHLLNPCKLMKDCYRVLRPGGQLVLLTPNISTYCTAVLILLGKMPSSGPHPDSYEILKKEEIFKVSSDALKPDTEEDTPVQRHLIVCSYRVLRDYLYMIGFTDVTGHGFGLYPFPKFMQRPLELLDPFHCHQMVFVAGK